MTKNPAPLLALLASSCAIVAQHDEPATPQRPTLSSDTSTTAPGTVELEAGVLWDPSDVVAAPVTVKYGAGESTEVFAGWVPLQWLELSGEDEVGVGDVVLGVRHRFEEAHGDAPSAAVQLAVKIPTANEDEGLGTGEMDGSVAGILTKDFGRTVATAYYSLDVIGDPTDSGTAIGHSLALAAGAPLAGDLGAFGELAGVFVPELDADQVFTTWGAVWSPRASLVLDAGIVVGLSEEAPDFQLVFGFTQNLGQLRRVSLD